MPETHARIVSTSEALIIVIAGTKRGCLLAKILKRPLLQGERKHFQHTACFWRGSLPSSAALFLFSLNSHKIICAQATMASVNFDLLCAPFKSIGKSKVWVGCGKCKLRHNFFKNSLRRVVKKQFKINFPSPKLSPLCAWSMPKFILETISERQPH